MSVLPKALCLLVASLAAVAPTRVAVRSKKGLAPDIRFRGKPLDVGIVQTMKGLP